MKKKKIVSLLLGASLLLGQVTVLNASDVQTDPALQPAPFEDLLRPATFEDLSQSATPLQPDPQEELQPASSLQSVSSLQPTSPELPQAPENNSVLFVESSEQQPGVENNSVPLVENNEQQLDVENNSISVVENNLQQTALENNEQQTGLENNEQQLGVENSEQLVGELSFLSPEPGVNDGQSTDGQPIVDQSSQTIVNQVAAEGLDAQVATEGLDAQLPTDGQGNLIIGGQENLIIDGQPIIDQVSVDQNSQLVVDQVASDGQLASPAQVLFISQEGEIPASDEQGVFDAPAFENGAYLVGTSSPIEINEQNFPDENFRAYLKNTFDQDGDDKLDPDTVASINVPSMNISKLDGIECFTNLTSLDCSNNQLTNLDVSSLALLDTLFCNNNQLGGLTVSGCTSLTTLYCNNNQLSSLDVSSLTSLGILFCGGNRLTSLDVSNHTLLTYLNCGDNQLASLKVSGCTALTNLSCGQNLLKGLDVSSCTSLTNLDCGSNQLSSLERLTSLKDLNCSNNQLTSLDVKGCTSLSSLVCSGNRLMVLDVGGCTALSYLDCSENGLSSMDLGECPALKYLYCYDNQLGSLYVYGCSSLESLNCSNNELTSLDVNNCTKLISLDISNNYSKKKAYGHDFDFNLLYCGVTNINYLTWNGNVLWSDQETRSKILNGTVLKVPDSGEITYEYNCGRGFIGEFKIYIECIGGTPQPTTVIPNPTTVPIVTAAPVKPTVVPTQKPTPKPTAKPTPKPTAKPTPTTAPNKPQLAKPNKPMVEPLSKNRIRITWKKVPNAKSYTVYKGNKKLVKTKELSYTIKNARNGREYSFKITASAPGYRTSEMSDEVKLLYLSIPASFKVTAGKNKATIAWISNKKSAGYQIRYSLKNDMESPKTVIIGRKRMYIKVLEDLESKKTYYFQIRACKKGFYSAWSAKKKVRIK